MASNVTAQPNSPGYPKPGPTPANAADPLPLLTFTPSPSLCQQSNVTAMGGSPGVAGPLATMPTTPWQDFGQPMGQTSRFGPPAGTAAYVDGSDSD